jgi:serine kinase of HPr protein (carbohydrate metabolism regulator)
MSLITKGGVPERPVPEAIDFFSGLADANDTLIADDKLAVLTVRHESLVRQPQAEHRRACEVHGVGADDSYLDACAEIVFGAPQHTRDLVVWTEEELEAVQQLIDRHAFLAGYSWTSVD